MQKEIIELEVIISYMALCGTAIFFIFGTIRNLLKIYFEYDPVDSIKLLNLIKLKRYSESIILPDFQTLDQGILAYSAEMARIGLPSRPAMNNMNSAGKKISQALTFQETKPSNDNQMDLSKNFFCYE